MLWQRMNLVLQYQLTDGKRFFDGAVGDVLVICPKGVVGEYCPLVKP
jgi:hypothetical protein